MARVRAVDRARTRCKRQHRAGSVRCRVAARCRALSGPPSWWLRLASCAAAGAAAWSGCAVHPAQLRRPADPRAAAEIDAAILTRRPASEGLQRPGIRRVPEVTALGGVTAPVRGIPPRRSVTAACGPLLVRGGVLRHGRRGTAAAAARQARPASPAVASLSSEQRAALAPLQGDWPADRRARARPEVDRTWPAATRRCPRRTTAHAGTHDRVGAPESTERAQARLNFQQAKQLPEPGAAETNGTPIRRCPRANARRWPTRASASATGKQPPASRRLSSPASATSSPIRRCLRRRSKPVAPTVVQAAPGATTTLVTRQPAPLRAPASRECRRSQPPGLRRPQRRLLRAAWRRKAPRCEPSASAPCRPGRRPVAHAAGRRALMPGMRRLAGLHALRGRSAASAW